MGAVLRVRESVIFFQNEMDDGVGQIMSALKEAGVDENTFVFFTSDNG